MFSCRAIGLLCTHARFAGCTPRSKLIKRWWRRASLRTEQRAAVDADARRRFSGVVENKYLRAAPSAFVPLFAHLVLLRRRAHAHDNKQYVTKS